VRVSLRLGNCSLGDEFDTGLLGHHCWLELANGERIELPVYRWTDDSCDGDELLLAACQGPTLDIGCGPGRLAAALAERGVDSLGIDSSRVAVRLARERGAIALHRNVFDRLPGEGRWRHVLLADGNIGIGGDPAALLRRVTELLALEGAALIELDPPGCGLRHERVRLLSQSAGERPGGSWFAWAWVGVDVIADLAAQAALRVEWTARRGNRWFAELVRL
jgi:SAM-dependent methyltransferase